MLQIPIGPQGKPRRGHSPGYVCRECVALDVAALKLTVREREINIQCFLISFAHRFQEHSSSEDIVVKVDEVCLVSFQMMGFSVYNFEQVHIHKHHLYKVSS